MTVAVTGAAGFIGGAVIDAFEAAGVDTFAIDDGRDAKVDMSYCEADVANPEEVQRVLGDLDDLEAVIHLAGIAGVSACEADPVEALTVNAHASIVLAHWCQQAGVPLVFPSTVAATVPPRYQSQYGASKAIAESGLKALVQTHRNAPVVVFTQHNVVGSYKPSWYDDRSGEPGPVRKGNVVDHFARKAAEGAHIHVHEPGRQTREFVHVRDVADAYLALYQQLETFQNDYVELAIGSDDPVSIREVAEEAATVARREYGRDPTVLTAENPRENVIMNPSGNVQFVMYTDERLGWRPEIGWREIVAEEVASASERLRQHLGEQEVEG